MFPVGANLRFRADSLNKILISTVQSETLQVLKRYEERIFVLLHILESLHHTDQQVETADFDNRFW